MPPAAAVAAVGLASAGISARSQRKAQKRAESFARSQEEAARAEQRRLEEKFGLTSGELERQDRVFELEKRRQAELERRAGLPGEELLREEGPITRRLLEDIESRTGLTGEELFTREGDINRQLVEDISNFDENIFQDELSLVLDEVRKDSARRNILGRPAAGDITLENLGRAGVDFAVNQARDRLANRKALAQAFVNLSQGARAEAGNVGASAIRAGERSRDEVANFLGNLQTLDAEAKGRAAQVGTSGFATAQNAVNQFGSVPIQLAAFDVGEAAELKNQGLGAIGDVGGTILDDLLRRKPPFPDVKDPIESREERDPLEELVARSGRAIV